MLAGFILMSVWKVWLEARRRDFAPFGALPTWPLSPQQTAPAIVIGEVHHPVEAREIFNPSWLTIPERGLYTGVAIFGAVGSGKTSACMHPFAQAASLLASGESTEAGGSADARSQGRFLSRYPPNPDRGGPRKRLHRAWHEGPLAVEPALGLVARFLLAGLHRFEPSQPAIREGQGTVLAASLYQPGPLDHRASPNLPGTVGDVAAGLPLRHRPGPFRSQDRASRSVERRVEQRHGFHSGGRIPSPHHDLG